MRHCSYGYAYIYSCGTVQHELGGDLLFKAIILGTVEYGNVVV